jgi:hypothetical protein
MKLEGFLNPDSLAALGAVKVKPAALVRALVPLDVPEAEPKFGEDCPSCRYVLYLRVVLWPPGRKPKGGPTEAWWCGRCERYYVYQEKRDGSQEGRAPSTLPQVQRPHGANGGVLPVREGGMPGTVQQGRQERAL